MAQLVKNLLAMWVDLGSVPRLGSSSGEEKGYPLQYSGLENSMDCIVYGGLKESEMTEPLSLSLSAFHYTDVTVFVYLITSKGTVLNKAAKNTPCTNLAVQVFVAGIKT